MESDHLRVRHLLLEMDSSLSTLGTIACSDKQAEEQGTQTGHVLFLVSLRFLENHTSPPVLNFNPLSASVRLMPPGCDFLFFPLLIL